MKKKLVTAAVLTLAAISLVVVTVLTTIAYLTSSSAVTNTFTVGNVGIELYESPVDAHGTAIKSEGKKTSNGNNYHLLPGETYDKDPTVYIQAGSDSSYLFVKVRNTIYDIEQGNFVHTGEQTEATGEKAKTIKQQMEELGWKRLGSTATGDVYVYAYGKPENVAVAGTPVGGTTGINEVNVFKTFTIDQHADVSLYGGAKVNITAFAIQTAGFAGDVGSQEAVLAAWSAIVDTYPYESGTLETGTTTTSAS